MIPRNRHEGGLKVGEQLVNTVEFADCPVFREIAGEKDSLNIPLVDVGDRGLKPFLRPVINLPGTSIGGCDVGIRNDSECDLLVCLRLCKTRDL